MKLPNTVLKALLVSASVTALSWLAPTASAQSDMMKNGQSTQTSTQNDVKAKPVKGQQKLLLNNGVSIPEAGPDGKKASTMGNGWVRYRDGTLVVPEKDGSILVKRGGQTVGTIKGAGSVTATDIWSMQPAQPASSGVASAGTSGSPSNAPVGPVQERPQAGGIPIGTSGASSGDAKGSISLGGTNPDQINGGSASASTPPIVETDSVSKLEGGIERTTSSQGEPTFTLPNGQQIPQAEGDVKGRPDGAGGVIYDDGTHVGVNDRGNTVVTTPQGGTTEYSKDNEVITRDGVVQARESEASTGEATYTLSNGQQVPQVSDRGGAGAPDPKGGVLYEDGTLIYVDAKGNTVSRGPDGTVRTYAPNGDRINNEVIKPKDTIGPEGQDTITLGNGDQIPRRDPSGGLGQFDEKGQVTYSDGTVVYVDERGQTQMLKPGDAVSGSNDPEGAKDFNGSAPGDGANSGTSNNNSGSSGSSSGSSSDDKDKGSSDSDDDSSSSDDSDDTDSSDESSDDSGSDDGGDDGGEGDDATKNTGYGSNTSGAQPEAKTIVDGMVARKTGESRSPDETKPSPCGDQTGGAPGVVSQPMAGETGNCAPTVKYEGNDNSASRPVFTEPARKPSTGPGSVINPQGLGDQINENMPGTLEEQLEDIEGVVNPK